MFEPNKRRTYSQNTLKKALEAIRKEGLTLRVASKKFGVPKSTLFNKIIGKYKEDVPLGRPTILSPEEEQTLVGWINKVSNAGFCVTKEQLLTNVAKLVKDTNRQNQFANSKPGDRWFSLFLKRHKEIADKVSTSLTRSRTNVSEADLKSWLNQVKLYIEVNEIENIFYDSRRIFSADESGFFLCSKNKQVSTQKGSNTIPSISGNNDKEYLTVLIAGNAAGDLAPPVVMYPYTRIPHKISNSIPDHWCFDKSDSGWMTGESFSKFVVNVFYPWLLEKRIQLPVALFINAQTSFINKDLFELCSNHQIELIALYPNSYHVMQPMDVAVFDPLKNAWRERVEKWQLDNKGKRLEVENFAPLLKNVIDVTIKKKKIVDAFKVTGLLDLNPINIKYQKLLRQGQQATPSQQNYLSRKLIEVQEHLSYLEVKIGLEKVQNFYRNEINLRDEELFNVLNNIKDEISGLKNQIAVFNMDQDTLPNLDQVENEVEHIEDNFNEGDVKEEDCANHDEHLDDSKGDNDSGEYTNSLQFNWTSIREMPEKMIPIHCPLCCDQPFEDQQSLFFHLRALRNNLFCTICSDRFDTFENLINHLSRKCNGPSSLDAKRKCLQSINLNQGGYQPAECSSTDNLDEPEVTGHPSSLTQLVNRISESSGAERVVEPNNVVHSSTSNKPEDSILPEVIIPPELKNKLSKSVTLSIGPLSKKPNAKTFNSKPSKTSSNIEEISINSGVVSSANLSSKNALSKIFNNLQVDVTTKTPSKPNSKTIESKSTFTTPTRTNVVGRLEQSQSLPSVGKNTLSKASSPLTVQSKKPNEITISSTVDSQLNTNTLPNTNFEIGATLQDPTSPQKSNQNLMGGTPNFASTSSETLKRKRGRPKKYTSNSEMNSKINVSVNKTEPRYVLPDILDEADLYGTNDENVNNIEENQDVSASNDHCLQSDSSEDNHFDEDNHIQDDDDDNITHKNPDLLNGFNSSKSKLNSTLQNKDKNCQLNLTAEKRKSLEKIETSSKAEGVVEENESKSDEEEEYTCSACNVRFTSICEHIREFHNGEEVVVEVPEEEINEELKAYQGDKANTPSKDVETTSKGRLKYLDSIKKDSLSNKSPSSKPSISMNGNPPHSGEWISKSSGKKIYHQFINNKAKLKTIVSELENNTILKQYNATFKDVFENPKINLIELTNKDSAPFFTYKKVDFQKPMPMYVVERNMKKRLQSMLGDSASYVLADPERTTPIPETSTLISLMNVILASDKQLTVENVVFNKKPCDNMVPVLEDVTDPVIPLLKNAKMLKWMCTKCLTVTWKFPLSPDSHLCNTCLICHKPFVSSISLKKHLAMHKRDGSTFCCECNKAFANRGLFQTHMELHDSHALCSVCKLFVSKNKELEHQQLHNSNPHQQFSCSVCQKLFGSNSEVKGHEIALCSRLVAKFNCSVCDMKFFSLTALSFHMKKHKSIVIQYPCRFCNKTFIREKEKCLRKTGKRKPSSYIQKIWHERIHTRERPYLCSACPKRFRSLLHQQSHATQAHQSSERKELPVHMCRVCDKTFLSSRTLSSHMLSHGGNNTDNVHNDSLQNVVQHT